ncbi:ATP-binding protein [Reyranella aquatilis]|uniref:ATP-binding protein n=1 Tax=Reyranella aquatilis TaxID=2035356 RepID=A0ABS8KV24_9HYPH|nr:ATP-binding protein [Reyranella aquatilis]MCC8429884.1 ATP-binding protein [Reyranella aquatilis]
MGNSIENSYERFTKLLPEIETALGNQPNEADTRLKVLDRVLFEVLDWKHEAVFTEPATPSGFIDYLLTVGERRNALVIEAKRSGFLEPATKGDEVMHVALSGPVVKPLRAGIEQALRYATENGVPVAVVTDGKTWLFFKASRTDGQAPMNGKGVLFPNLKAVASNFAKFSELLNVGAIIDRKNLAHLHEAEGLIVPEAEQQYFVLNPIDASMRQREALASDAALLFAQFFSRLSNEKDREMLRDCFVETAESRKADFELEKIVQRVLNNITALDTGQSTALQAELQRTLESKRSETVLLVGNNGAGKSTFIDRFFEDILPRRLREKCVVVRVDLEEYDGDPELIVSWMNAQLREQLEIEVCASMPPTYDELMGVFFQEYQRWSVGSRKHLYETDKIKFKDEFGKHMEDRREKNPGEYVRLLLDWAVRGHQKLPCLVFDNTDQFPAEIQDKVYQAAHSYESASALFNVVPITDRTIWRLSKAGALQSYSARNFYLPVPDAKEIISRRVDFLKRKVEEEPRAAKLYFSRKGFQVEVNDLAILADAVGKVFVENDYVTRFIGRLGNFNIRRMLKIAERIFLSPELKIDDIIKSRFGGEDVTADRHRTHRALIKGEYDRFSESENEYISNLFQTNRQRPGPPLLPYYILAMLRQKLNAVRPDDDNIENQHWLAEDLCRLFEGCGVSEDLVMAAVVRLYDRRLIEALDPNAKQLSLMDKVAIKDSGLAHLEMFTTSPVYIEQMALVTGLNEMSARDEIRQYHRSNNFPALRDEFLRYITKIDNSRLTIPTHQLYSEIAKSRRLFDGLKAPGPARRKASA